MAAVASLLPTIRLAALGTVVLFSVIVLGLSSHVTYLTNSYVGGYYAFAALAIATAVLSIVSLPVLIIVDIMRKGAFTSMIVVELGWLGFLWILWLSSGATAAEAAIFTFVIGCNSRGNSVFSTACREFSAIQAFSFLNWLILLGYTSTLLLFCIVAANRGHKVWNSSVKDANFNAPVQYNPGDKAPQFVSPQVTGVAQPTSNLVSPQYPPTNQMVSGWAGQPQGAPTPAQSPYPQV